METLSVLQSLIMALWVAAIMSRWLGGGATLTLRFSPLMTGLVAGLVMGASCVAREFEAGSGYRRSGSCRSFRKLFISIPFLY